MKHTTLAALTLLTLVACSKPTVEEQIANAERLVADGENAAAIIEYKNVILEQPNHPEARFQLGKLHYQEGAFAEAEKEMRRAIDAGVPLDQTVPILIKAAYYQNDFLRVLNLADEFNSLSDAESMSSVALFTYLSEIKTTSKDRSEVAIPAAVLNERDLILAQAMQALATSSPATTVTLLTQAQATQHEQFETQLMLANAYAMVNEPVNSIVAFEKALELYPDYHLARFLLADELIKDKQLQRASEEVEKLLSLNPNSGHANFLKAQILFYEENYNDAMQIANLALQNGARTAEASFIAGISAYNTGRLESALRYLSTATNSLPSTHMAHRLLAQVKLELGYVSDVVNTMDSLNVNNEQSAEIYGLAALQALQLGNVSGATKYIEQATRTAPSNPANLLRKGLIELETDDSGQAIESLTQALSIDPELGEAWQLLAEAEFESKGIEAAVAVAKEWQQKKPLQGWLLEGFMYLRNNDEKSAAAAFEEVLKLSPDHVGALRYLMIANARDDQSESALQYGLKLLQQTPDNLQNIMDVINLQIAAGNDEIAFIEELIAASPQQAAPKAALGLVYLTRGEPQKAIDLMDTIPSPAPFSVYMVKGDSLVKLKQYESAVEVYQEWTQALPNDSRGWMRLITTYQFIPDYVRALEAVKSARDFFPRNKEFQLLEANLLVNQGEFDRAKRVLKPLEGNEDALRDLTQVQGVLALNEGRIDDAVTLLRANYAARPAFYSARLLAQALGKQGNASEGAKLLDQEAAKMERDYVERHIAAEYCVEYGLYDEAVKQYEILLAERPEDYATLNNYANTLSSMGELDKATELAEKVLKIAPQSPFALDTYGLIMLRKGDIVQGQKFIEQALSRAPENVEIQLHMVEVFIAIKQLDSARNMLRKIKPVTTMEKALHSELQQKVNQLQAK